MGINSGFKGLIELFEYPDLTPLDYCLLCWVKGEGYKRKTDATDESPARILDAAARIRKAKINSDKNTQTSHTSCKCAWKLTVGFSKISIVTIFSLKHYINILIQ